MDDRALRPTTFLINVGHGFAHLLMLLYPTVVLALEQSWGLGYAELLRRQLGAGLDEKSHRFLDTIKRSSDAGRELEVKP